MALEELYAAAIETALFGHTSAVVPLPTLEQGIGKNWSLPKGRHAVLMRSLHRASSAFQALLQCRNH